MAIQDMPYELLEQENRELRDKLNAERFKNAHLQESVDSMTTDLSLMEARIAELEDREPFT